MKKKKKTLTQKTQTNKEHIKLKNISASIINVVERKSKTFTSTIAIKEMTVAMMKQNRKSVSITIDL